MRVERMASCYLGPALVAAGMLAPREAKVLRPAAAVVMAFGVLETVRAWTEYGPVKAGVQALLAASVVAHVVVYAVYAVHSRATPPRPGSAAAASVGVMTSVMAVYAATRTWPYRTPPAHAMALCACVVAVSV